MYDIYFKDDYDVNHDINNDSNGSNDVIDGFFMDKVEVERKENMKCAQQKKIYWFRWYRSFFITSLLLLKT